MLPDFKFHHVGIAVRDMEATATIYVGAGYSRTNVIYDPIQNVDICFLNKDEMPLLELLASHDETSPVYKLVKKEGVMPYHLCYEVDDMTKSIDLLKKMRYVLVVKPVPAVALENRKVCFLYHKQVGLIELLEA